MDQEVQVMIDEMFQRETTWKAANPEPICQAWPCQEALDRLVASGFALVDEDSSWGWKREAWQHGKSSYRQSYKWTEPGREACFRNRYSTPMAWAEDIHQGHTRHCVVCGRDCYKKQVWARKGNYRCVCMSCGSKGRGLQDLEKL